MKGRKRKRSATHHYTAVVKMAVSKHALQFGNKSAVVKYSPKAYLISVGNERPLCWRFFILILFYCIILAHVGSLTLKFVNLYFTSKRYL